MAITHAPTTLTTAAIQFKRIDPRQHQRTELDALADAQGHADKLGDWRGE